MNIFQTEISIFVSLSLNFLYMPARSILISALPAAIPRPPAFEGAALGALSCWPTPGCLAAGGERGQRRALRPAANPEDGSEPCYSPPEHRLHWGTTLPRFWEVLPGNKRHKCNYTAGVEKGQGLTPWRQWVESSGAAAVTTSIQAMSSSSHTAAGTS